MPRYHKLGKIPHKRHTTFKKENGGYHYEELFGTIGFDGMSTLLYHIHRPTQVVDILNSYSVEPKICLLYTSPSPRDRSVSRMPSSA